MTRARDTADTQDNIGGAVAPFVGAKNFALNGSFDIWQRGTSFTSNTGYTADRWYKSSAAGRTYSRQTTSDTTNLPTIQYCLRASRDSGNTATDNIILSSSLESANAQRFVGQTVTLSFYARKGANFSPSSSNIIARLYSGTGTDQNVEVSYTGSAAVINQSAVLTTTWQRFQYTGTVGTTATELAVWFAAVPTGTAGANDYFEITGIQLELGSQMTPFARAGGSIGGELALCQRYYFRTTGALTYLGSGGIAGSATQCYVQVKHPTTMRVSPTSIDFSLLLLQIITTSFNVTNAQISAGQPDLTLILATTAGGLTATTQSYIIMTQNNAAAYFGLGAEL
jgi:hypothetical protein